MNVTKTFIFFAMGFLAVALLSSALVSAASTFTFTPSSAELTLNKTTQVTLSTNSALDITVSALDFTINPITLSGATITLGKDTSAGFVINNATSKTITLFVQSVTGEVMPFGDYKTTLTATGTDGTNSYNASIPVTYVQSFCKAGSQGTNLTLKDFDVSSSGDEDEEWRLLDKIDVEVKVENTGDNDIDDVQVELGIFDSEGNDVTSDLDFDNADEEQIDLGNLNDGDDEIVNFEFTVPADFDTGNYKLAVKVYSDDNGIGGESRVCDDASTDLSNNIYQTISVDNEDEEEKFIVVDDIRLSSEATCGETVTGSFTVFNIGDEDQDQVLITLKNTELGLNQEFEIREDLDKGEDDSMDFSFEVPANARDGTYSLTFKTFYDYDDRDDSYDQESEDEFSTTLKVIGCNPIPSEESSDVAIDAELASDAVPGQELKVTVTFRNDGTEDARISLNAEGYESWGDLASISRRSFTLGVGDEQEVTFTFDVNADVTGSESFLIAPTINGKQESQEVEVDFGSSETGNGFNFSQGSGLIWIIGIINVVLIVLIIVVAIKLSRR